MLTATAISWTDTTWNPTTGCSKVSEGCRHCYAETLSLRFRRSQLPWTARHAAVNVRFHPERLRAPYRLRRPSRIFVNSMSDLFHEQLSDAVIRQIWDVMCDLPQHTFQILTKRPARAAEWPGPWPAHIWQGTSIESRRWVTPRLSALRQCPATIRFLSCEPLLEDLGPLDLSGIHWLIVGGESGPGYRPMPHAWARALRDQCVAAGIPFFFKQSAAARTESGIGLEEPDGSRWLWRQMPGTLIPPQRLA
jgi:protein gp37